MRTDIQTKKAVALLVTSKARCLKVDQGQVLPVCMHEPRYLAVCMEPQQQAQAKLVCSSPKAPALARGAC